MTAYEHVADLAGHDSDLRVAAAVQAREDRAAQMDDARTIGRDAVAAARDRAGDRRDRSASRRDAARVAEMDSAGSSSATTSVLMAVAQAATLRTMAALDRRAAADERLAAETGGVEASVDRIARAERELAELDRERHALGVSRPRRRREQA